MEMQRASRWQGSHPTAKQQQMAMESSHSDTASIQQIVMESTHGETASVQQIVKILVLTSNRACSGEAKP
jgi:hypothetical protein